MRPFLVSRVRHACLLLAGAAPFALHAETVISSTTTSNIRTSTAANGSADDVTISSTGVVSPTSGAGVTIDSSNKVSNAGNISINNVDNTTGIAVQGGVTSTITNSGTIRVDDSYAATDTNGDGVVDGAFAQGTGRTGISLSGTGAFTGTITNSGSIIIEGNNSGGIVSSVPIVGSLISSGATSVLGDNGTAIRLGAVSGNVTIAGATSATGQNSVGVALTGTVGALVVHGAITSTGYSATTAPTDLTKLTSDNLLQGGSALVVGGNVTGGVLIGASLTSTTDTTADTDADGIADVSEGVGSVTTYGSAPALLVGSSSNAVTLGAVASDGTYGLVNNGSITGSGVYSGVNATGVQIGGLGQAVTIAGGIKNSGTIQSSSIGANSTALYLASGAVVPTLLNTGTIYAYGSNNTGSNSQAIKIDAGASLPSIVNAGTIRAIDAVTGGLSIAILDTSGTLTSVTNKATIASNDLDGTGRAIDVSANTSGFTYTQAYDSNVGVTPNLTGAILTGSGNDTIAVSEGTVNSAASLGAGNDTVALSNTAVYVGSIAFGAGDDSLSLTGTSTFTGSVDFGSGSNSFSIGSGTSFTGTIANSASNIALTVASGGTLALTSTSAVALSSLSLGGTITLKADPANGIATQLNVAGATTVTAGAALKVSLSSLSANPFTFTLLRSGTLTGSANLSLTTTSLPYILSGTFAASDAAGTISLTIAPRAASSFGFRGSEGNAYNAVYAAIVSNSTISNLFLGLTDRDSTLLRYRQMLPDYEGGTFDMLSKGARTLVPGANAVSVGEAGDINLWAQQGWWNATQKADLTIGYKGNGWGLTGGADIALGGFGRIGVSIGYLYSDVHNSIDRSTTANDFQGGIHWFGDWGGLKLSANGAAGFVHFGSQRSLSGTATADLLTSSGHWNGLLLTGNASASYEAKLGALYLRPSGTLNYAKLHEKARSETGGGAGYDLTIASRDTSELSATGLIAVGVHFGKKDDPDATIFRIEAEGGRREIVSGSGGTTTAHFTNGSDFTLTPEERKGVYVGNLRFGVGSSYYEFSATAGGEMRGGYHGLVGRLSLRAAL